MKKILLTTIITLIGIHTTSAQVGIGTEAPDASAQLELQSIAKGFLPPRMDTDARNNINSPAEGLVIYNIENGCLEFWNNSFWVSACDGSAQPGSTADCATSGFIPPYLTADQTEIVDVTNPVTNQTWMDRNLGAYTADRTPPASYNDGGTDCWAYGNLYQWGRNSDGHESRLLDCTTGDCLDAVQDNSKLPTTAADVSDPTFAGKFIYNTASPYDWHHDNPDDTLWQGVNGTNNPCPTGYRVPTEAEWEAEWDSWDGTLHNSTPPNSNNYSEGAINSPLKLPVAGTRRGSTGELDLVGTFGIYWSSTVSASTVTETDAWRFLFNSFDAAIVPNTRYNGYSVRCIKDQE